MHAASSAAAAADACDFRIIIKCFCSCYANSSNGLDCFVFFPSFWTETIPIKYARLHATCNHFRYFFLGCVVRKLCSTAVFCPFVFIASATDVSNSMYIAM